MYLWNNIFFSFAHDLRGVFKNQGGDSAAHAAAGADLHGIMGYLTSGIPELCVLATTVVDYAGHRLVAQAIVPGELLLIDIYYKRLIIGNRSVVLAELGNNGAVLFFSSIFFSFFSRSPSHPPLLNDCIPQVSYGEISPM